MQFTSNYNNKSEKNQQTLKQKLTKKKKKSIQLARIYKQIGYEKKYYTVLSCSDYMLFSKCENGHTFLKKANFCKDRLCPVCNWRRSRMLSKQILQILHELPTDMQYIFITLTIKNVKAEELTKAIKQLNDAFSRMRKKEKKLQQWLGYVKVLEVTYNQKTNEFHPHFHILVPVTAGYFTGRNYISKKQLETMWQKALGVDYIPVVHIEKVKPKRQGQTYEAAVQETAKYPVKDSEYLSNTLKAKQKQHVVKTLSDSLKSIKLITFGGVLKDIKAKLKLQDVETATAEQMADIEEKTCTCPICNSNLVDELNKWHVGLNEYIPE